MFYSLFYIIYLFNDQHAVRLYFYGENERSKLSLSLDQLSSKSC